MDGPLLDLADPAVRRMIKLAKRRGYVTSDELDEILPPDEFSVEQIEDVLGQLAEMGIRVVASVEGVQDRYRYLARELRSFANGQGGRGATCSKARPMRSISRPMGLGRLMRVIYGSIRRNGGFWSLISSMASRSRSVISQVIGSGRVVAG
jgi:hypothetical protein